MSEDTKPQPESTIIRVVSVKVSRRVDLGYVPYIVYLKQLNGRPAPFGTRDQSNTEFDVFMSAEVGAGVLPEDVLYDLATRANEMVDQVVKEAYPKAFTLAAENDIPEDVFVVGSTKVVAAPAGEF